MDDWRSSLHPLERAAIRAFKQDPRAEWSVQRLAQVTELGPAQMRSAAEWLRLKGVLDLVGETTTEQAQLTDYGRECAGLGTPEVRLYDRVTHEPCPIAQLPEDERAVMGTLKNAGVLRIEAGRVTVGDQAAFEPFARCYRYIKLLPRAQVFPLEGLDPAEIEQVRELAKKRGKQPAICEIQRSTDRHYRFSVRHQDLFQAIGEDDAPEVNRLTPEMLKDGSWKDVRFRRYAVGLKPARKVAGRAHPYRAFLDGVRGKLLALGFEEMTGPLVESEFWNMDALFMPQFHPAREIHDAYYLAEPTHGGDQPPDLVERVAAAHERGEGTGGKGWGYDFDRRRTRRLVLRSQGTSLSARTLAAIGARAPERRGDPGKYFAIARCFRYDQVDATHAPDFLQVEGIVLGPGIHLRHLLGLLELFAREMARAKAIRFAPAYFPFTEPSVEVHMQHPELGWMELGGAGIFRPEVTRPLGVDVPVIAWGLGLDRMAMVALGIKDIRDLFSPDLELLRGRVPPPPT